MQYLSLQQKLLAATICMFLSGCVSNPVTDTTEQAVQDEVAAVEETVTDAVSSVPQPVLDTTVSVPTTPAMPNLLDPLTLLGRSDINGEAWLLEQDPTSATLQVLAADNLDTVKSILPNETLDNVAIFKKQGRYAVVYGIYPDSDAARKDKRNLPSWVADKSSPFPLSLTTVIGHIKNR